MLMLFLVILSSLVMILLFKANPKAFSGYEGYFYLKKVSLTSGSFWMNLLAWAIAGNYKKHRDILATIFLNVVGRVLSLTIAKIIS